MLNIIEDENGILRCIGRLENSDLNDFAHRPLILPRANTGLLI
jgi:hypothetical protein